MPQGSEVSGTQDDKRTLIIYKEIRMFTVLIGSVARGEQKDNSDIDIVRINHEYEVDRQNEWPLGPINYIDYSISDFHKLYNKGSLFIYHILNDGILLSGCCDSWKEYTTKFQFIDTYLEELNNIRDVLYEVFNTSIYGGTFLSFYSNIFTLIKNFSIFYLAHNSIFDFNKESAFLKVFGKKYFYILNTSYNIFERNEAYLLNSIDIKSELIAKEIINYLYKKLEELI